MHKIMNKYWEKIRISKLAEKVHESKEISDIEAMAHELIKKLLYLLNEEHVLLKKTSIKWMKVMKWKIVIKKQKEKKR